MSLRWAACLLRWLSTPRHMLAPGGASDDSVIQDSLRIRRALNALSRTQVRVTLQSPDGLHVGVAVLFTDDVSDVVLLMQAGGHELPADLPHSLNAIASGEHGLLFFTLHTPAPLSGGRLRAGWPDTLIQVQSRRHFRVSERMDGLCMTLPGARGRVRLRDISEEGVGWTLEDDDWSPASPHLAAQLHLGDLTLPVPALQLVHSESGRGAGQGNRAGARLGGMSPEHVRQLRCWLAAWQAASLAPPPDQT